MGRQNSKYHPIWPPTEILYFGRKTRLSQSILWSQHHQNETCLNLYRPFQNTTTWDKCHGECLDVGKQKSNIFTLSTKAVQANIFNRPNCTSKGCSVVSATSCVTLRPQHMQHMDWDPGTLLLNTTLAMLNSVIGQCRVNAESNAHHCSSFNEKMDPKITASSEITEITEITALLTERLPLRRSRWNRTWGRLSASQCFTVLHTSHASQHCFRIQWL